VAFDRLQQQRDALSVLDIRTMHHHFEQKAQRIDQQVSFASGELFASIVAMRPAPLRGFDRLTIDNGRTGCRLTPR
jgi:hypothetical protein